MTKSEQAIQNSIQEAILRIQEAPSLSSIKSLLDSFALSADMKALLYDIARVTVKVANTVIAVGRRVLSIAIDLFKRFPNTTLGVIVALTISTLLGAVPVIGLVLSAVFTKLLVLLGITAGAIEDIRQHAFKEAMDRVAAEFRPLNELE